MVDREKITKAVWAGLAGAIYGGFIGLLIAASIAGRSGIWIGAVLGTLYFGIVEAATDFYRKPGEHKPLWHRVIVDTLSGAALGSLIGLIFSNFSPVAIGLSMGVLTGLRGLGPRKLVLGVGVGLAVGILGSVLANGVNAAVIGGAVVLLNRLILIVVIKESEPVRVVGENVPQEDLIFVVPFEARTAYVGVDYSKSLAVDIDGIFNRNLPGIGIVESLDSIRGPSFNPELVAQEIRDFYEHTSQYKLSIIPKWNPFVRPFFWFFKTFIARRIGQADIPFNSKEAQRGMISYIDSIDYGGNGEAAVPIETLRVWIRAYEDTDQAIYVGIYTVLRHEGTGYVSVGFPLPEANFTATLKPFNNRGNGLLLKTKGTGSRFPGHYLSDVDQEGGKLTTLQLTTMDEEIDVFVENGRIKTEHRFYFSGSKFLTLFYDIEAIEDENQT